MINENSELIIELWARIKSHIAPKERLEVADILIVVFDEFGKVDDDLMDEDLDKELRAAVTTHIGAPTDDHEDEDQDYDE